MTTVTVMVTLEYHDEGPNPNPDPDKVAEQVEELLVEALETRKFLGCYQIEAAGEHDE